MVAAQCEYIKCHEEYALKWLRLCEFTSILKSGSVTMPCDPPLTHFDCSTNIDGASVLCQALFWGLKSDRTKHRSCLGSAGVRGGGTDDHVVKVLGKKMKKGNR